RRRLLPAARRLGALGGRGAPPGRHPRHPRRAPRRPRRRPRRHRGRGGRDLRRRAPCRRRRGGARRPGGNPMSTAATLRPGPLAIALLGLALAPAPPAPAAGPLHWVASWGTAAAPPADPERLRKRGLELGRQTVREIVHLSLGGATVRVRVSNLHGSQS